MLRKSLFVFIHFFLLTFIFVLGSELILRFKGYHSLRVRPEAFGHSMFVLKQNAVNEMGRSLDWFYNAVSEQNNTSFMDVESDRYFYKKKNLNVKRVIAIGDSGTFGSGVARNKAWPAQLESEMNTESNEMWEVMNFGIPGALVQDSVLFYKQFLREFKPNIVILCLFLANDINQSFALKKNFYQEDFKYQKESFWSKSALFNFLYVESLSLNLREEHTHRKIYDFEDDKTDSGLHLMHFIEGEIALYKGNDRKLDDTYLKLEQTIRVLDKIVKEDGGKLVLTYIPSRSTLDDTLDIQPINEDEAKIVERYRQEKLSFEEPLTRVKTMTEKNGIPYIETIGPLKLLGANNVLIKVDDHLNEVGHKILSEIIAHDLIKDGAPSSAPL